MKVDFTAPAQIDTVELSGRAKIARVRASMSTPPRREESRIDLRRHLTAIYSVATRINRDDPRCGINPLS